ncbi:MAG: ABC transporter ATP-binding protein/permease [Proteobacteria bacterium]|nr:ABC transporter ATP-binding protein/permease [Pseudomonadota bacterium]
MKRPDSDEQAAGWLPLLRKLGAHRSALLHGLGLLLLTNALEKTIPWLLKHAVDDLVAAEFLRVQYFAAAVVGCAVAMTLVRTRSRVRLFNIGRDIEYELRNDLLGRLHRLGSSFFRSMGTGDVMSRAINDLGQVRLVFGFGLLNLINSLVAYTVVISLMATISGELTLYALAPYPFLMLATGAFGRAMYGRSRVAQSALGELSERVQETLSGIRLVRVFGLERAEQRRFGHVNERVLTANVHLARLRALMWPVLLGVSSLAALVVLYRGANMCLEGRLSAGELAAFLAYTEQLVWPTLGLGYLLSVLQRGKSAYARIHEILAAEPDVVDEAGAVDRTLAGDVVVRGLCHSFGSRRVVDEVGFDVAAGGKIAIVGQTGSGKSTLAALLARVLPSPSGRIFVGGTDIAHLTLAAFRRSVGYAQQEPFLFSTTVAKNIGFALDEVDSSGARHRIHEAAARARVASDIEAMPEGFETVVGERGVQLSGGQKQRIALARALLLEPRVLILDDPLSAVDAKTEAEILEALDEAAQGRTVILVTHRVAAARRADEIVVLEHGKVVERGTHEQLIGQGGSYSALAARQRLEQELAAL